MTSLIPRSAYSQEEVEKLYPKDLQLQHVQVILRHGERVPVTPRFMNAGLSPYWPYCSVARKLTSAIMATKDWSTFDKFDFKRRVETFGHADTPVIAPGSKGEIDSICTPGELTDKGRETTLALGERLRNLYVNQLGFIPATLEASDAIYLRATPIPRALESVQQAFHGLYPPTARAASLDPVTIVVRSPADETLFPNDTNCKRYGQLTRAFANRAAQRWNNTPEMDYLNKKLGKWMPEESKRVAVDGHPRLGGIMDTLNATLGHGRETRLPPEFYEDKVRKLIEKISCEEWFAGHTESREYRMLGIGGLTADITTRMVGHVESNRKQGRNQAIEPIESENGGKTNIKFCLSGAHDTTIAGILSSLGAFENAPWPPYTSHVAVELFRTKDELHIDASMAQPSSPAKSWWSSFPFFSANAPAPTDSSISRKQTPQLSASEKSRLDGHYVRIRHDDRVIVIPGCRKAGRHLEGDESFCTLQAFKEITDKYAPMHWRRQCRENLDQPAFPKEIEPAGY